MEHPRCVWLDGQFLAWDDARIHVSVHSLHYGLGILEGTRAYAQAHGGAALFRLADHLERLRNSARILQVDVPYTSDTLTAATMELVARNHFHDCYVRHLVFLGSGNLEPNPRGIPVQVLIICWPLTYLPQSSPLSAIRCKTSSLAHHFPNAVLTKAKATGHYINAVLALREAISLGFQESLLLDSSGCVSEATGHNVFAVRRDELLTPPLSAALEGITRDTVLHLARFLRIAVRETPLTRDALYISDEVFLTGTAGEIVPVGNIDDRLIGEGTAGPLTMRLKTLFHIVVRGEVQLFSSWLLPIIGGG